MRTCRREALELLHQLDIHHKDEWYDVVKQFIRNEREKLMSRAANIAELNNASSCTTAALMRYKLTCSR